MQNKSFTIKMLAQWMNATQYPQVLSSQKVTPIWMDSRKIEEGDIFLALEGEERDGHDYVASVLDGGAQVAIVASHKINSIDSKYHAALIVVDNPLTAVQNAAKAYRQWLEIPIITIAGSNGKTTTAHYMREILSTKLCVGGTIGNWNNHIGVPLSMLRLQGDEEVGIFEIGANHIGEIAELSAILEPDMGIITNVGYAHVGFFGGINKTVQAKFELADQLLKNDGELYLNSDDGLSIDEKERRALVCQTFGTEITASIMAQKVRCRKDGCYSFEYHDIHFDLHTPGLHTIYSILPALAMAEKFGISLASLVAKVASLLPADLRGGIEEIDEVRYIVDCYNANPSSMKVAGALLRDIPHANQRIAVLGDMRELGEYEEALHYELGEQYAHLGIDILIAVGSCAEIVVDGAKKAGLNAAKCFAVASAKEAVAPLIKLAQKGDLVLLKGSRGVALETILEDMKVGK